MCLNVGIQMCVTLWITKCHFYSYQRWRLSASHTMCIHSVNNLIWIWFDCSGFFSRTLLSQFPVFQCSEGPIGSMFEIYILAMLRIWFTHYLRSLCILPKTSTSQLAQTHALDTWNKLNYTLGWLKNPLTIVMVGEQPLRWERATYSTYRKSFVHIRSMTVRKAVL